MSPGKRISKSVCGIFALVYLLLNACSNPVEKTAEEPAAQVKNRYASYFKISRAADHTIIVLYLNATRNDSATYVLYKTNPPDMGKRPLYVQVPVNKVACMGSIFVGFLNRLNKLSAITAVDNLDFISNTLLLSATTPPHELSKGAEMNMEKALISGAELIFTNPSGDDRKDFDHRLLRAKITPVVCADYFENEPLGRAEWLRVFGCFFDQLPLADSLFAETVKRYNALREKASSAKKRPTVLTEIKTNDTWFVAGGKSSTASFIHDAGADYLWRDNGKSEVTAMNMEQVIARALNADYWLHLHLCMSKSDLLALDKRYASFNAFRKGQLYNNNARLNQKGGNAFWEDGLCNPDEILADLLHIFHPEILPDHTLKYYRRLQ